MGEPGILSPRLSTMCRAMYIDATAVTRPVQAIDIWKAADRQSQDERVNRLGGVTDRPTETDSLSD